jgi:serine/threonine protein kinase
VNQPRVDSLISVKGLLIGTPGYTAPEGGALCTQKADIFSASLILLELLSPRFSTSMERFQTLECFRTQQIVKCFSYRYLLSTHVF